MKKQLRVLSLVMAFVMAAALAACGAPAQPESTPAPVQTDAPPQAETPAPSEPPAPTEAPEPAVTITDHAGRAVTVETTPQRIVSGYYISTSLCIALGLTDRMVGIEAKAENRPIYHLAAPQLLTLKSVGSAKEFDLEGCIALEPDLVILPARLRDIADTLEGLGINVLLINPESQRELEEAVAMIAAATGTAQKGEALINYYHEKLSFMSSFTPGERPSVYLVGAELLRTAPAKMYQTSVIENAHGTNVASDIEGSSWVDVSYEQLIAYNPEYIIIIPESGVTVADVMADAQLSKISAVTSAQVYQMPTEFEAWDSPVPSGILGSLWLLSVLHEDDYGFDAFTADAVDFYQAFYDTAIDAEHITK